jgi:YihY family inner membrane protein
MPRVKSRPSWLSGSWWGDQLERRLPGPLGRIVASAREDDIVLLAGSLAFYAVVSLIPLAILSMWITSLILGDQRISTFAHRLADLAPKQIGIDTAITQIARQGTRIGLAALVVAIWPASAYGAGLERAFLRISPHKDRQRTPMLGRGLLVLVLLPMFVIGTILASLIGSQILGSGTGGQVLGIALALLAAFALAFAALVVVYLSFPPQRLPWPRILEAAAGTATSVSILSLLFVVYLNFGANFQARYASSGMAAVVLLALWLFLTNILVLTGYRAALATSGKDGTAPTRPGRCAAKRPAAAGAR